MEVPAGKHSDPELAVGGPGRGNTPLILSLRWRSGGGNTLILSLRCRPGGETLLIRSFAMEVRGMSGGRSGATLIRSLRGMSGGETLMIRELCHGRCGPKCGGRSGAL